MQRQCAVARSKREPGRRLPRRATVDALHALKRRLEANRRGRLVPLVNQEQLLDLAACEKRIFFLSFPYVCPEPVLAK